MPVAVEERLDGVQPRLLQAPDPRRVEAGHPREAAGDPHQVAWKSARASTAAAAWAGPGPVAGSIGWWGQSSSSTTQRPRWSSPAAWWQRGSRVPERPGRRRGRTPPPGPRPAASTPPVAAGLDGGELGDQRGRTVAVPVGHPEACQVAQQAGSRTQRLHLHRSDRGARAVVAAQRRGEPRRRHVVGPGRDLEAHGSMVVVARRLRNTGPARAVCCGEWSPGTLRARFCGGGGPVCWAGPRSRPPTS